MDERRTVLGKMAFQNAAIEKLVSETRDLVTRTMILLHAPAPDLFLGRQTQGPPNRKDQAE